MANTVSKVVLVALLATLLQAQGDEPTAGMPEEFRNAPRASGTGANGAPPGQQSLGSFKTPQPTAEEQDSTVLPAHMHCDGGCSHSADASQQ